MESIVGQVEHVLIIPRAMEKSLESFEQRVTCSDLYQDNSGYHLGHRFRGVSQGSRRPVGGSCRGLAREQGGLTYSLWINSIKS